jgi:glycerol-3-phosphate acyltransferase PlsX
MRIGIDAMGGDFAPAEPVEGALRATEHLSADDQLVLIGDERRILEHLDSTPDWERHIRIEHAPQVVGGDEAPVEAVRLKPDSSIARMADLAKTGEVDAIISAGNTGACVAACQMRLRRLRGVHRPGIAIVLPTYAGPVVLIDVGANVNCRPNHLYQYALMASVYSQYICGVSSPRIAVLSIGEEETKGTTLVKQAGELLRSDPRIDFVGNVEGRDLFHGACDVVVAEAFVGNVALKLIEGLSEGLFRTLLHGIEQTRPEMSGQFREAIVDLQMRYDFNNYGGAPLLGINGVCIICHGASRNVAITNAVKVAQSFVRSKINDRITDRLTEAGGAADE